MGAFIVYPRRGGVLEHEDKGASSIRPDLTSILAVSSTDIRIQGSQPVNSCLPSQFKDQG